MENTESIKLQDVRPSLFISILLVVVVIAITTVELGVAFNTKPTRIWVREAMWAGSVLWVVVAVLGWAYWLESRKKDKILALLIITMIAVNTVINIFVPNSSGLAGIALITNAILWVLFSIVMVIGFLKELKDHYPPLPVMH